MIWISNEKGCKFSSFTFLPTFFDQSICLESVQKALVILTPSLYVCKFILIHLPSKLQMTFNQNLTNIGLSSQPAERPFHVAIQSHLSELSTQTL